MKSITIERSSRRPLEFQGECLGTAASENGQRADRDTRTHQYFTAEIYRTDSGRYVANVHYRSSSKLGRECPVDDLFSSDSAIDLVFLLNGIDGIRFITGWQDAGQPSSNGGVDMRANHQNVVRFARLEWKSLVDAISELLRGKL